MKSDSRIISRTGERKKRRFDARDMRDIAEFIMDEFGRRKRQREGLESHWDEIDRQIAMEPEKGNKIVDGQADRDAWMPEMELPNQAQALEVLTADARRMILPDSGNFFIAHAALTDEYLSRVDFQSLVAGDETEVPSQINQDNADKLVQGIIGHWHRQYDFGKSIDLIDAEAFRYGMGMARVRVVSKDIVIGDAKGTSKRKFPALLPRSIRNTYPDPSASAMMHEGFFMGEATIYKHKVKYRDLILAATRGSSNPDSMEGGWMARFLTNVRPDDRGEVEIVEYEGDLVVPRKTVEAVYLKGAIATIVAWQAGKESGHTVIRLRFRKHNFSTYINFPYHYEDQESPYATSPLMKGRPIQKAGSDALNRMIAVAALNAQPPIGYDSDDSNLISSGGPQIYPGASWATLGEVKVHQIGDPAAMFAIYSGLLQQYADVTGINAPRLGAQTVSHTTAFAKDVELSRGESRTVDYVRNTLKGPLHQLLHMEYVLGRENMGAERFFIDEYGGFVDINKTHLPDEVAFDVHGAGGPQEEQARLQKKYQALQLAMQLDLQRIQTGLPPKIDGEAAILQILREGGWTDVDFITTSEGVAGGAPAGPEVGALGQLPGIASATPPSVA